MGFQNVNIPNFLEIVPFIQSFYYLKVNIKTTSLSNFSIQQRPMEDILQLYFLMVLQTTNSTELKREKELPPQLKNFFKMRPLIGRESLLPDKSCNMNVEWPIFSQI